MRIGSLFSEGQKTEHYYKNKMLKKLKTSKFHGPVKMVNKVRAMQGTAAIIAPYRLFFWPENQADQVQEFDLTGCEAAGGIQAQGLDMILTNEAKQRWELRF